MSNPYDRIRCSSGPPQRGAQSLLKAVQQHPLTKLAAQEAIKKFWESYPEIASILEESPIPITDALFNKQAEARLHRTPGPVKDAEFEVIE